MDVISGLCSFAASSDGFGEVILTADVGVNLCCVCVFFYKLLYSFCIHNYSLLSVSLPTVSPSICCDTHERNRYIYSNSDPEAMGGRSAAMERK